MTRLIELCDADTQLFSNISVPQSSSVSVIDLTAIKECCSQNIHEQYWLFPYQHIVDDI